jgi:histidinol-phosphate aminotransferase
MKNLVRKCVARMKPYVPGEQPRAGGFIKLNTNECPYPPAPAVLEALRRAANPTVKLYPDPVCLELRREIARRIKTSPDDILVTNGSDEALRLIFHAFLNPREAFATLEPTYTLYETLGAMFDAKHLRYPVKNDFSFPEEIASTRAKLIIIANPNPPVGTCYPPALLARLCDAAKSAIVVIDEAYVDFAEANCLSLLRRSSNLIIARSFSKSFALAGMRVGYCVSSPRIMEALFKIKDSYNVSRLSQIAGLAAVRAQSYYRRIIREIKKSRESLVQALRRMGMRVPPSQANFIFALHPRARELYEALKRRKILVRYFDAPGLRNGIRISIGTAAQNRRLVSEIKRIIEDR